MGESEYKRVTREEAFARDPMDATPIEYEDEVELTYYNLDTGETKRFKKSGIARIGGSSAISPAIRAYYEKQRNQTDTDDNAHRNSA